MIDYYLKSKKQLEKEWEWIFSFHDGKNADLNQPITC